MGQLRIEPLNSGHRKFFKDFRNQEPSLVEYILRYALRHMKKDYLSWTYLAIDSSHGKLAGYFTLSVLSVERKSLDPIEGLSSLPRFPIPGVLLARLAVDERVQGQGLGRYLFEQALGLALDNSLRGPLRGRLFVTDAINQSAEEFYSHFGMQSVTEGHPKRMILDLKNLLATAENRVPGQDKHLIRTASELDASVGGDSDGLEGSTIGRIRKSRNGNKLKGKSIRSLIEKGRK